MLIPRPFVGRGSFDAQNTSEDAVHEVGYSADCRAAQRECDQDILRTFTESLILAQDERWRRA
jgi:hypothetical protein